MTEAVVLNG